MRRKKVSLYFYIPMIKHKGMSGLAVIYCSHKAVYVTQYSNICFSLCLLNIRHTEKRSARGLLHTNVI
jgi:hypothetical protein